ncbi:MAG: hypothetical protein PHR86_08845, partial [Desulfobacterales bacterium]|nr:hypothetical protein [Desulfobacterales bacterium]
LAMRAGRPCLVHAVGGWRDTVTHGHNGFSFEGKNLIDQVDRMALTFKEALDCIIREPGKWQTMRQNAAATRFPWTLSAQMYIKRLYVTFSRQSRRG